MAAIPSPSRSQFVMYSDISENNSESCDSNKQNKLEMEKKTVVKISYYDKERLSGRNYGGSDEEAAVARKKRKSDRIRKYHAIFLTFGFMQSVKYKIPHPQCMICGTVLPNTFMKLSKLRRHFMNNHPEFSDCPTNLFVRNLGAMRFKKVIPE